MDAEGATATQDGPVRVCARKMATPLGSMVAGATVSGLLFLEFVDSGDERLVCAQWQRRTGCQVGMGSSAVLDQTAHELEAYFAGTLQELSVPVHLLGTEFQRLVWQRLREVPYGATVSYGELAREIGRPRAVRAVGRANGANPIAVVVPCHRAIGRDGRLIGYGGGLWRKVELLSLEGVPSVQEAATQQSFSW